MYNHVLWLANDNEESDDDDIIGPRLPVGDVSQYG